MELIDLLPKVAEYGTTGIVCLTLYLVAQMYRPHFATMSDALKALPPALAALVERIEQVEEGLGDVQRELAVIKDRLPRSDTALLGAYLSKPVGDRP